MDGISFLGEGKDKLKDYYIYLYHNNASQVVANMRGNSAEEVAERILSQPSLSGLQVKLFGHILEVTRWVGQDAYK